MRETAGSKSESLLIKCGTETKVWISVGDPWHFDADPDPHLWLKDLDPTPDPTPFFSDFKDSIFFLIFYSQAHYLQS